MTLYAYDEKRSALIATWETGIGLTAEVVAGPRQPPQRDDMLRLAAALSTLSRLMWQTYTHPVSAADSVKPNSEGWRRQLERDAFAEVLDNVKQPNLPQDGVLAESYILVEEAAHRVGRALHHLQDETLVDRVVDDIRQELASIERAEAGDLSGRARQAVHLTRADASPLQVSAADELLHEHPLGSTKLFQQVDPTAAAVAAAHWLHAAATVAGEVAECEPAMVVVEADNIEALAIRTPTLVLERLEAGETPRTVVTDLVAEAMLVAEGRLANPAELALKIEEAKEKATRSGSADGELLAGLTPRATPLDPMRPAHDLLEDLLEGVRGCWLLYCAHADVNGEDFEDFEDAENEGQIDEEFFEAVRAEAAVNRERLL